MQFSSRSGNNFDHRLEWERIDRKIAKVRSFNYYPRGRVEIKNSKATAFLDPILNKECIVSKVISEDANYQTISLNSYVVKSDVADEM